jgi:excisionase family DNA binding protein
VKTTTENNNELLTCEDVAREIKLTRTSIWAKCRSGELPHMRLNKRCFRIRRSDLEQYLAGLTR